MLIIKQVNKELALKEIALVPFQTSVQKLIRWFSSFVIQACVYNKHSDALATLPSSVDVLDERINIEL